MSVWFVCVEEGWKKINRNLCRSHDDTHVYLWYEAKAVVSMAKKSSWTAHDLVINDYLDVKDTVGKWTQGQVIGEKIVNGKKCIEIHYIGWGDKFNEFIDRDSDRLKEAGTIADKDYRPKVKTQGASFACSRDMIHDMMNRLEFLKCGALFGEDKDKFLGGDLEQFVEKCMSRQFDDVSVIPEVFQFFVGLTEYFIQLTKSERVIEPIVSLCISKIFYTDSNYSWFYEKTNTNSDEDYGMYYSPGEFASFVNHEDVPEDSVDSHDGMINIFFIVVIVFVA